MPIQLFPQSRAETLRNLRSFDAFGLRFVVSVQVHNWLAPTELESLARRHADAFVSATLRDGWYVQLHLPNENGDLHGFSITSIAD